MTFPELEKTRDVIAVDAMILQQISEALVSIARSQERIANAIEKLPRDIAYYCKGI